MAEMMLNICYRCLRQQALKLPQRSAVNFQRATFHTTSQLAKAFKSKPKKLTKQQPLKQQPLKKEALEKQTLEYKPPTRILDTTPATPTPPPNPFKYRSFPFLGISVVSLFIGGACGYIFWQASRVSDTIPITDYALQADVSNTYEKIAKTFDNSVDSVEASMGIDSLRQELVAEAKGDVLEVSFGTGRNLEFYDWNFKGHGGVGKKDAKGIVKKGKVRSLTAVDKSEEMLEIAHDKFSEMFPGILGVRWVIADASEQGKIPGPPRNANETSGSIDKKYDTVIQTFGLCSVNDPVALLKNLGNYVKEEEGRILLLEHGRAKWGWLNSMLDNNAEKHAKKFGCWWNRDMNDIVQKSGLEVVNIERPKWWHGGTTWWIELKKPKSEVAVTEVVAIPAPQVVKKGWW